MADNYTVSLEAARVNRGLTQEEASKELGISKTTLVNWEKGKSFPDIVNFKAMCNLYSVPMGLISVPDKLD
jgi:DNA-binding XRE family transcriptional regulator